MRRIVVQNSLTLDGVMQAPGRPDEDRRGGFTHGGWATPYFDSVMGAAAAEGMGRGGAMLFGRRTYEDFASVWPNQGNGNPFAAALNNAQKYVASRTLREPLPWSNSTLLRGDAAEAVARLKEQPGKDLVILGSGELIQSLMRRDLIDQFVLLIHPLVLGSGSALHRRRSIRHLSAGRHEGHDDRRDHGDLPARRTDDGRRTCVRANRSMNRPRNRT